MALSPPVSEAADLWGRKSFLVVSTVFGFVGCMIVSRAQNMATIIAGFTVVGVAFASQSLLLAVVSEVLPRKHRPIAQAVANIAAGLGAMLGICMGGGLTKNGDLENFRIYFYVNAAIFAVGSLICVVLYNPPPRELPQSLTRSEKIRRLDWIGYAILPPGLTLLSIAFSWSENPYPWKNAHILAPLLIGAALTIVFIVYEVRFKKDGMLHHSLFKHRNFPLALAAICAEGFIFFSCNNYFPFEVSVFQHSNTLVVGLHWLVSFAVSIAVAIVTSTYASYRKVVRAPLVLGFFLFLVFVILMATANRNTSASALWGYPALVGAGFGTVLPNILSASQLSTPREHIALASGLMVASRGVGGVVSLAINNAIFNGAMTKLAPRIAAATLPLGLPPTSLESLIGALASGNPEALKHIEGATPQILSAGGSALLGVYELGFRNVWICASCVSCAAVIGKLQDHSVTLSIEAQMLIVFTVCAFFNDLSAEFTNHIDAPAESIPSGSAKVLGQSDSAELETAAHEKYVAHHENVVE
jgi:MFS family permease